ncbi:protein HEG-like [Notothenia coriiceps]|uniref:Protein HEG-like n=1 Tax=Notothenia coriiceps TaxID=8208 RepID=A0A6I9PTB7_9TELE|nr:PREDICTED: protein HEG-like [Notothenia coriiceps]
MTTNPPITSNNTTTNTPIMNNDTTTIMPITSDDTTTNMPITSSDTTTIMPITINDTTTIMPITINDTTTIASITINDTTAITKTTQSSHSTTFITTTTQQSNITTTPATTQTSKSTASTPTEASESSTAVLTTATLTNSTNTSPETPVMTTTLSPTPFTTNPNLTAGPQPSSPTSITTSSSLPTSPSSSTAAPTGNTTTLSPSATNPGVTIYTTMTQSPEPSVGDASASSTTLPTPTSTISTGTIITYTTLRPTEVTTTNSTTAAPPTPPVIVCPSVPCPLESVCLNGTCQCLSGSFLVNGRCAQAQVFSGKLHLTSLTFKNEMSNRSSVIFHETASQISATLRNALKNQPGYKQSDVVQLKPGSVQAIVNNIFENTNTTQKSVDQAIQEAIIANPENTLLANATFIGTNLCVQEPLPCEVSTTMCTNTNGRPLCSCREGYISILYSNSSCKACPSGQRAVGDTCQPCAFGYAGFNCNDSALLAVVVISCVLGGILIILLLALLIYCFRMRSSKSKPDLSRSPYSSGDLNHPWPTGITPIPRATSNWDAATPIEMTDGGSARAKKHQTNGLGFHPKQKGWKKSGSYDLNPDGMNTFTGKNPSRYSYLVQGHENPYFLPGEGCKN